MLMYNVYKAFRIRKTRTVNHNFLPENNLNKFFLIGTHLMQGYKAWSNKKKKHKKIKTYRKYLYKEPKVNRCLLILDLKSFRL